MRKKTILVALAGAALAVLAAGIALAGGGNFRAHLTGEGEVPDVETRAQGQAVLSVDAGEGEASYRLIVSDLDAVTQAHIHCGGPEVNGPVVVFLFGLDPSPDHHNGVLATGTFHNSDVIPRPDSAACPGGVANFEDLLEKIEAGQAYVNVHTTANPGGEIRGQIE